MAGLPERALSSPASLRWRACRHIRRAGDFDRIYAVGKKTAGRCLVVWWTPPSAPQARLAVVASRRVGGAVARNRARRRLRELFRGYQHEVRAADVVLVARAAAPTVTAAVLREDFRKTLVGAGLWRAAVEGGT